MPSVLERIISFNKDRLPEMTQLKYQFMAEDPFRFFRGTCHLFYEDLSKKVPWTDPTKAWICGDLHLENFGSYKGDNRVVYFDLNDFDESVLAPATWDLVRFLTSVHIAAQVLPLNEKKTEQLCNDFMETYIATLKAGKALAIEKQTAEGIVKDFLRKVANRSDKELLKARTVRSRKAIKLNIDGQKFLPIPGKIKKQVLEHVNKWFDFHYGKGKISVLDAAYRIAGTGSVGVKRFVVLKEFVKTGTRHLVDIKEAKSSSVLPYVNIKQPEWENEAERVKTVQKRGQYVQPAWLHSIEINKTDFIVKELQPLEDKMDLALCKGKTKKLSEIICTMAELTAAEQLRSSGRQHSSTADELIAFAMDEKNWKQKVLNYALKYSKQVLKDYESYVTDYKKMEAKNKGQMQ